LQQAKPVLPRWLSLIVGLAFIITGIIVSALIYLSIQAFLDRPLNPLAEAAEQVSGLNLQPLPQAGMVPIPTIPDGQALPTAIPTSEILANSDRVNILVMGIDRRPGEPFISRTDTMMLMSIDTELLTASILSIPRDLYVIIPGIGRDRINTAFVYGSAGNNPAGGAELAKQTVEYNLGVPVHHYVMVDFNAVTQGIDAIGGIDVNVPTEIYDPTFPNMDYGYDPLYVAAGLQHFDGSTALKYARTRHQDNDFNRARRQQQVVMATRDKVLGLGIGEMIDQAPTLFQQLSQSFRTDLSLNDVVGLGRAASEIPNENIRNEVIDHNYVTNYRTEMGASVLIPINDLIAPLLQEMFYSE
jgi:LCP family protein required for cell wall assembly